MNEDQPESGSRSWRTFLIHEAREYAFNVVFLSFFLVAFAWYRRLVLATYHIQYLHYWMPLIEAAILAKVIMLGDALHIGQRMRKKPLAIITIYRTVAFSLFVGLFTMVESMLEGMLHGKSVTEGLVEIAKKGPNEILASCILIFAAFLPFFAMKEIEKSFGQNKVRTLFFRKNEITPKDAE